MNAVSKITLSAGLALALATVGTMQARAGGWPVAAAVVGGIAAGTVIGATIAQATALPYAAYPAPVYAPAYGYAPYPAYAPYRAYAPVPAASIVVRPPARAYYYPRPVYAAPYLYGYPYGYPYARLGYGWGPRRVYHYRR